MLTCSRKCIASRSRREILRSRGLTYLSGKKIVHHFQIVLVQSCLFRKSGIHGSKFLSQISFPAYPYFIRTPKTPEGKLGGKISGYSPASGSAQLICQAVSTNLFISAKHIIQCARHFCRISVYLIKCTPKKVQKACRVVSAVTALLEIL